MKLDRHAKILQIIEDNIVETQDDLAELLRDAGFNVTQATVSRDIRELKLIKVMTDGGRYKYASYSTESTGFDSRVVTIFREAVLTIDYAGNFVCLHTITGMASAAAVAIDTIKNQDIVGCVAGDDTIFILMRSEEKAKNIVKYFKNMLKK
ncbi:MAG: arginine repressor [Anaerofustis stercorihominis]|nr:arginine repressor [Anaerofustis stercorihominis]